MFTQAIKALQDKLTETRAAVAPRAKFTFKTKKNHSALSLTDAVEIAAQGRRHIPDYRSPDASSRESSINPTPNYASTPVNEPEVPQLRPEIAPMSSSAVLYEGKDTPGSEEKTQTRLSTYPYRSSVAVNSHYGLHIVLPASSAQAAVPASITSLRRCIVDMSSSTASGKPYASLTIKGVKESLLICGQVKGPSHITNAHDCVLVVSCRQFRMHNCADVDVYLSCSSSPIIEDCTNIQFGRLPKAYVSNILSLWSARRVSFSAMNVYSQNLRIRLWIKIVPTRQIAGIRSRILNGSNLSQVRIGSFLIRILPYLRKSGQKLFQAVLAGLWKTFSRRLGF
jgi:tubulin-specific chaperone C